MFLLKLSVNVDINRVDVNIIKYVSKNRIYKYYKQVTLHRYWSNDSQVPTKTTGSFNPQEK